MALIKQHTLINGSVGEYWRINKLSIDAVTGIHTVTLALYKDKEQRQISLAYPLPREVQFFFMDGDHPVSGIDMSTPIESPPEDFPSALMYRHIRAVASAATLVEEANRTQNEHVAVFFADATDDV